MRLFAFAYVCVCVCLRVLFAIDRVRVRACARAYVRIYTQLGKFMHGITCVNFIYTDEHCAGQRPGDQPATRSAQLAVRGGEQVEGDAQALPGIQGLFRRIQRYHRGGSVPASIGAPPARLRYQPGCACLAHV